MNKIKYAITSIIILIMCFSVNITAFGDLGDFNDYGDSGWDSGGWGYDSDDWDYDDDDYDDDDYDYDDDDYDDLKNDHYYVRNNSNDSSGKGNGYISIAIVIIIIILANIINKNKPKGGSGDNNTSNNMREPVIDDNTEEITKAIIENDPDFSGDSFMNWAREAFYTLQYAWSARDFSSVRPFEKEELYNQHTAQIQQYKNLGRINVLERINVNNAYMYKYVRDFEYEYITVYFNTRMVDYIKDEKTGNILKGSPDKDCYLKYLYTFMRKTGVTTKPGLSNKSVTNCPNCGAPTEITSSGKCEYCDSVITTGEFDWVLSNIEGVKKNVPVSKGGVFITNKENKE